MCSASRIMDLLRYAIYSSVVNTVLGIAPLQCLQVEICYGVVHCKCSRKFPKNLLN